MTSPLLLQYMPQGFNDLLIQAAISPTEQARVAWQQWLASRSLDEASWAEVRMLPSIAARARELNIDQDLRPRLDGIRRFVWSATQKKMLAARPVIAALAALGITPMLLKGSAIIAGDLASMAQRFLRDIDVLVSPAQIESAVRTIFEAGWSSPAYPSADEAVHLGLINARAIQFLYDRGGEIDLHQYAMLPNPFPGMDQGLWSRARKSQLLSVDCLIPAFEDLLVNTLEHSFRRDPDKLLDWSIDAAHLIRSGQIDWPLLTDIAHERCLATPVEGRLRYLSEHCGVSEIPASSLEKLRPAAENRLFVAEYRSYQFGRMGLPGARDKARLNAIHARALKVSAATSECSSAKVRPQGQTGEDAPLTVRQYFDGRRIDIRSSKTERTKFRLDVHYAADFPVDWGCWIRVRCGAINLCRYSGRRNLVSRLWNRSRRSFSVDRVWFASQQTDAISLILNFRKLQGSSKGQYLDGIAVECKAQATQDGSIRILLTLGMQPRSDRALK